jgi:glycosyltransferase involved in cell wall biosynthesis
VRVPPSAASAPAAIGTATASAPQQPGRLRAGLGRLKRRFTGPPRQYRPRWEELQVEGGLLHRLMEERNASVLAEVAASRAEAEGGRRPADVTYHHDPFTARDELDQRDAERGRRQVWLMIHAPIPIALYQAWCWGVPEAPWEELARLPDVAAWIGHEVDTLRRADRLILPCREAADELVRVDPRFAEPMERADWLLTGAAGPPRSQGTPDRAALRRRWKLPADAPVGLFLGNDEPYRGLDLLLSALDALPGPAAGAGPAAGVVAVAGPQPAKLPRHPRLRALGRVSAVSDLLAAVDFVVNVNRFSLFDLSTIEALDAGKPLLLSPVGGNLTFRDLGVGCRMLDGLAPAQIAAGLAAMFQLDAAGLARLGEASRTCYQRHLTPAAMWRRHLELYDRAANLASPSTGMPAAHADAG